MNAVCSTCHKPYEAHNARSRFCSAACRARNARQRIRREHELLTRQSEAIARGADPAVLAALAREAQRLLSGV